MGFKPLLKQGKTLFLTLTILLSAIGIGEAFGQATVTTDKLDYSPGEYVTITGSGWKPGETIVLHFDEEPKLATCLLSHDLTATADASGNFSNSQFLVKENHLGVTFTLTATGQTSGLIATTVFTDGRAEISAASPTPFSPNQASSAGVKDVTTITAFNNNGSGIPGGSSNIPNFVIRIKQFEFNGPVVSGFLTFSLGAGQSVDKIWNGKDFDGNFLPDGAYYIFAGTTGTITTAPGTFKIVTIDNTNPVITMEDIRVNNTPGACGAKVSWATPTVTDANPGTLELLGSIQNGDFFPIGATELTYRATDAAGNISEKKFRVIVLDAEGPVFPALTTITVNQASATDCGAFVSVPVPAVTDPCSGMASVVSVRSDNKEMNELFPIGKTTIRWIATDKAGNTSESFQDVVVLDSEGPVFPDLPNLNATQSSGTVCSAVINVQYPVVTDCGDVAPLKVVRSDGKDLNEPFPTGQTKITWIATDEAGNETSRDQFVFVRDIVPPFFTGITSIIVDQAVGICEALVTVPNPTASDLCGIVVSLEGRRADNKGLSAAFPVGTTRISWTARDNFGNSITAFQDVIVRDTEGPVFPTLNNFNVTQTSGTICSAIVSVPTPVVSDCSDVGPLRVVRSDGRNLSDPFPTGQTKITWIATDDAGNQTSADQFVNVRDVVPPVFTGITSIIVDQEVGKCEALVTVPNPSVSDLCGIVVSLEGRRADNKSLSAAYPVGTTRISWTARDNFGNSITAFQDVIVRDTEGPIFPTLNSIVQDQDAGVCQAVVSVPNPVVTDLCGEVATGFKITRSDGKTSLTAPFPVGKTTITWIATDKSGNESQATQDVFVRDTEGPIFETLNSIVQDQDAGVCQAVVTVPNPVVTDLCGEVATGFKITRSDGKTSLTAPFPVGKTTITWIATDKSGNESQATQDVFVRDTEGPIFETLNSIVQDQDAGVCQAVVTVPNPVVTDLCGEVATGFKITRSDGETSLTAPFPVGKTTITWIATDKSGNEGQATQDVIVKDTEGPIFEPLNPIVVDQDAGVCQAVVSVPNPVVTDLCGEVATGFKITRSDGKTSLTAPFPVGKTTITWIATDKSGNESQATQDVIVKDTEGPIFEPLNPIVVDQDAGVCQAVVSVPNPVVTDLCGEVATGFKITRSDGETSLTAPFPVGKTTITWIATDKSGNESQATQDVIVKDTEGPIFEPLNPIVVDQDAGVCQAVVSVPNPVVTDLCGEVATGFKITRSDGETSLTAPFPVGKTTITWIATDKSGNESQATQDVIVIDIEKPSVIGLPSNIVVNNDKGVCGALVSWTAPTSSDNCSGSTILQTAGPASGSVFPVGETTVTYTATDASGNTYSASFTVSVNDTEDPVIEGMPANISVSSDADKCGAIVTWTAPTAKDNCEVKTFTTSHAPGSLFPVGTTTVTYTAEDIHGNVQTASFDVTVTNNAPSNLVITAPIIPQAIGTAVNVSATFVDENIKSAKWTAFDGNIVTQTATISATGTSTAYTFTSLPAGVYTIILEVEDHCGLKASQQFEFVTVYDPNGGFVTGGGWIYSKPGDLRTKPEAEGRANFGFVAKYKTGKNLVDQVEGNTNFQFKEGDFHFKSTSHQNMSLVISGAKATYRGEGTVNGLGSHKFMVTVIDGDLRGELDKFRIRVWANNSSSDVIYDNEYSLAENAEATTLLGGGSIVIHKPVTKGNKRVSTEMIEVPWNTPIETVKKEVEKMSLTWFEAKKLPMTIQSDSYNPLVPGIYELKADLVENEFYSLDEPISILVMVQNKPMPLDITIDNNKLAKGMKAGEVIGIMRTLDPVDNIHTYTLGENPDVELDGDKLVWKGSTIPARLDLTVFSSDRAGQTISREITLRREMKPGEFFVYPNPATEETNVMVEMDQSSTVAIRIFDAVGRLVMENQAVREGSFTQKIDLQGLAAGMYTIQVEAGNMVMTKRLIKK